MKKRLLSFALALCMMLTQLPISAMAENASASGANGEIIAFAPLDETEKSVPTGTAIEDLELPEMLTATVKTAVPDDEDTVEEPVKDSEQPEIPTATEESAVPADSGTTEEPVKGSEQPEIPTATEESAVPADSGTVEESVKGSGEPEATATSDNSTAATTSSALQADVNEQQEATAPKWEEKTVEIPVTWISDPKYDGNKNGVYVFTPVMEGYTISADLPEITVTVGAAKMMLRTASDDPAVFSVAINTPLEINVLPIYGNPKVDTMSLPMHGFTEPTDVSKAADLYWDSAQTNPITYGETNYPISSTLQNTIYFNATEPGTYTFTATFIDDDDTHHDYPITVTVTDGSTAEAQWGVAGSDGSAPASWVGSGTLADAMTYANSNTGTYIQLLTDIALSSALTINGTTSIVIDLNGNILSGENADKVISHLGTGTLTITDNSASGGGKVETSAKNASAIYSFGNGKLIISGKAAISSTSETISISNAGKLAPVVLEIAGGTVTAPDSGQAIGSGSAGEIIVTDGTITGGNGITSSGKVTVSGGTVTSSLESAIYALNAIVTLKGGTFENIGTSSYTKEAIQCAQLFIPSGSVIIKGSKGTMNVEQPHLTGYTSYQWRTSSSGGFTLSTTQTYTHSPSDTYVEFQPYTPPVILPTAATYAVDAAPGTDYVLDTTGKTLTIKTAKGAAFWSASGTAYLSYTVKLVSSIDVSGFQWTPVGDGSNKFTGTFDGQGNTITGLTVNLNGQYAGLFGSISGATIKNVGLVGGTVSNVSTSASAFTGGIAGLADGSTIANCYNTGTVKASCDTSGFAAGGIAGKITNYGYITNCYNTGGVGTTAIGTARGYYSGGIAGFANQHSTIQNCYSTGTISAAGSNINTAYLGGIAGGVFTYGQIYKCYYLTSSVEKGIGSQWDATISNCGTFLDNGGTLTAGTADQFVWAQTLAYTGTLLENLNGWVSAKASADYNTWQADSGNTNDGYPVLGPAFVPSPVIGTLTISASFTAGHNLTLSELDSKYKPTITNNGGMFTLITEDGWQTPNGLGEWTKWSEGLIPLDTSGTYKLRYYVDYTHPSSPSTVYSNEVTLNVVGNPTTLALKASPASPQIKGTSVALTATLTGFFTNAGVNNHTITFKNGTTTLGTASLNSSGVATYTWTPSSEGTYSLTAEYAATAYNTAATSNTVNYTIIDPNEAAVAAAKAALVDGTVKVAYDANQTEKTAAVQAYVNGLLIGDAAGVTATVSYNSTTGKYEVALSKGSVNGSKSLSITMDIAPDPDIAIIAAAKSAAQGAIYATMTQTAAVDEDAIKAGPKNTAVTAVNNSDITVTINKVSYTAPIAGTAANPGGTNGTYTFTVKVSKGDQSDKTGEKTITITATPYTGGTGGNGNSGSSSTPSKSADTKPTEAVTGTSENKATVDDKGNASVGLTDKNITDAIANAKAEAVKKGVNTGDITAMIHVSTGGKDANTVTVNLPKTTQEQVIGNNIASVELVIDRPDLTIGMNLAAVTEINRQANADVQLTATRMDNAKLTGDAKAAIGNRPTYDLKALYGGGKSVTNFGNGSVSVEIPYTLQKGETAGNVYAVYVDTNGKATLLTGSSYDAKRGTVVFSTNHFSTYGIAYKSSFNFTDIGGHWAKDDILFVANRGLVTGSSATTFSPNSSMTRGMFVTALGRLSNVDISAYKRSSFTDVKADAYYMGYIEWSVKNNILAGIGDGKFAPDGLVTREQMAVIMDRYATAIGFKLPEVHTQNLFADNAKISALAAPSVKRIQMAGIIHGKNNNFYDPQGTATRAEVSAVLKRFVELTVFSSTAQGWVKNDSGQWMYFQNGKALTGWQTINGKIYCFDSIGGAFASGWKQNAKGEWLFLTSDGSAATGWKDIQSKGKMERYYFDTYGILVAGKWLQIDGKWYYFYADGSLAKSTKVDGYEVDEKGVRKTK